jgi:hypothetical protein
MRLSTSGNLGIGTSSPSYKLVVSDFSSDSERPPMSYDPSYIDPNPLVLSDKIPSGISITSITPNGPLSISNGGVLPGFSPYDLSGYPTIVQDPAFEIIKGEMLTVKMEISEWEFNNSMIPKPEIKNRLAAMLAEELLEHKNIEFTYQKNHDNGNISVRARCFVVPDDQVKILRQRNNGN